jgi:hypothetical protein
MGAHLSYCSAERPTTSHVLSLAYHAA